MNDIKNKEDIILFVNEFYSKVKIDPLLGAIFFSKLGHSNWDNHLDKMYSFWNTLLFGKKDYRGNPFSKHSQLPVEAKHFDRWKALLKQTIEANFSGPKAEQVLLRADNISKIFQAKLNIETDTNTFTKSRK